MKRLYPLLLSLLLFACAPSAQLPAYNATTPTFYAVAYPEAFLYDRPGASTISMILKKGTRVLVMGHRSPNLYAVKLEGGDGTTYYILDSVVTLAESAATSTPRSTYTPPASTNYSGGSTGSYHSIQTGPRGGKYYINIKGNKTYIKRK